MIDVRRFLSRPLALLAPLVAAFGLAMPMAASHAATKSDCPVGYTLGFFNGVGNTYADALDGMNALRAVQGNIYQGEDIKYEAFYNHTGATTGALNTTLQDVAEVFQQRAAELDASGNLGRHLYLFWEVYDDSAPGYSNGVASAIPALQQFWTDNRSARLGRLLDQLAAWFSSPPTAEDYAAHRAQLDADVTDGRKLLLVAHSQGNLFVNVAYDYILPSAGANLVKVVHIAPASPTLRGNYELADVDLVINGLRLKEGLRTVPDSNIHVPSVDSDPSGHTLVGTYLDPTRAALANTRTLMANALGAMAATTCAVTVSPATTNAQAGDTIALAARLAADPTDPDAVVTWQWTVTGNAGGTLRDNLGNASTSFESASKNVSYIASANALSSLQDTVTVTAYLGNLLDTTAHRALGSGTATVSFNLNPWVGTWVGSTVSTCGYYSGPINYYISDAGNSNLLISFSSAGGGGYSATYTGNSAVGAGGRVILNLSGDTLTNSEADSCQTASFTRSR